MSLYCVRCRATTPTDGLTTITTKNKRRALTGKCAKCGTKKYKFVSASQIVRGGDIAASLGKLPGTPWAKYPGEKHLPGYNYCGPGTRLDIRLDNQDRPKPGEYPVNKIDQACHTHDVSYKNPDLKQRHLADIKLIHALNSIPNKSLRESLASFLIKSAMKGKIMIGAGN
jgi:hypothetical protein